MSRPGWSLLLALMCVNLVSCELYTSVEELSRWPMITRQFYTALDELIRVEQIKLTKLKSVRDSLMNNQIAKQLDEIHSNPETESTNSQQQYLQDRRMSNPVNAFVTINRLNRAIEGVQEVFEDELIISNDSDQSKGDYASSLKDLLFKLRNHLPTSDDLKGSGQALLRLQSFYNIDIDDLTKGLLPSHYMHTFLDEQEVTDGHNQSVMDAHDCFELGRVAFQQNHYSTAIQWLYKSLEFASSKAESDYEESESLINDILDYMAFSAYKLGQLEYSAKLTQAWLDRDPHNDRAMENLQYYLDELEQHQQEKKQQNNIGFINRSIVSGDIFEQSEFDDITDIDNYSVADDERVRNLCQNYGVPVSNLKCYRKLSISNGHLFQMDAKIELLSESPKIMRIYDIISDKEAEYLRQQALPKLQRSTVHSGSGLRPSQFRIAKTAWIPADSDSIVQSIEARLSSLLGLTMDNSEAIQVVNYGLGGFYGPHLDSARPTRAKGDLPVKIEQLQRSDRFATILIYLNQVEAGGSTVFPRLNVSVAPIERSAVVWFNIDRDGYSDERTLHTGCPVLLGSKWIATKWPNEVANMWTRLKS